MSRIGVFLALVCSAAQGQFTYSIDQSIPVEANGRKLAMAWAGGLNSPQFNTMDLNNDTKADLVIFERASGKIYSFINSNNTWRYTPEYEQLFPAGIQHWILLRDFNCDGKKDIFTSDPFGITVYVNTSSNGQLSWREFNPGFPLLTKGFSGNINLKVNETDMPAIDDVDNDGDLDILNVRFVGTGTVEWHRNMSIEKAGKCDSLQLERVTQTYGNFEECSCGVFAFQGAACPSGTGGRTAHVGGKNLLSIDIDNDGDRDLLFAEESCTRLYTLINTGTNLNPQMTTAAAFPASSPINVPFFPAAYHEDVDFDGNKDMVVTPNIYARTFTNALVDRSIFFLRNGGSNQTPSFTFVKNNFLQEDMIEVGDYSVPAFADVDGDGDMDMFISFYAGQNFTGSIYYFENSGTPTAPDFKLITNNYRTFTGLASYNLKIQIADMTRDGKPDLVFTSTSQQNGFTNLQYIANTSDNGMELSAANYVITEFRLGFSDNLIVADVNQDGKQDFLIGVPTGALEYWENASPTGDFSNMVLMSEEYLGLGISTSRQNPIVAISDLDADGREDMIVANHRGLISIFGDFRNFDPSLSQPATEIIFNPILETYTAGNFGGRIWPVVTNLYNSDKPTIVMGNTTGGLFALKNSEGIELPEEPSIVIFPNPLPQGDALKVKSDRNVLMQIYSTLGQKMSEPVFIMANQTYPLAINNLASGLYIAKFSVGGKIYSKRFVLY